MARHAAHFAGDSAKASSAQESSRRSKGGGFRAAVLLVLSLLLVGLAQGLQFLFARDASAFFPAYRGFSKQLMGLAASLSSVVSFAVWDIFYVLLIAALLVLFVVRLFRHKPVLPVLAVALFCAALTYFSFVAGWALNHYAPALSQELGLEVREYSVDELEDATRYYLEQAARYAPQVDRSRAGQLLRHDFYELAAIAGASYTELGESYPILSGTDKPVKALLLLGEPLLYSNSTGIFWAPTGEANVPLNTAVADMPFTMCHEAAHRLAIASEQEANFAAFLACATSTDLRFTYAGYYSAFAYCSNALAKQDRARLSAVVEEVAAGEWGEGVAYVLADRAATSEHYRRYEGAMEEVGRRTNDAYLKSFGQSEGVQSYGLVVDYLIAVHLDPDFRSILR